MLFEEIVDRQTDGGHPIITKAHPEPMSQVS